MKKNIGSLDRGLRITVGMVLISWVFVGPTAVWGWVGLIPLLTGVIGFCPIYPLLGISTRAVPEAQDAQSKGVI